MNTKQKISKLINSLVEDDLSESNKLLESIVEDKIVQRIRQEQMKYDDLVEEGRINRVVARGKDIYNRGKAGLRNIGRTGRAIAKGATGDRMGAWREMDSIENLESAGLTAKAKHIIKNFEKDISTLFPNNKIANTMVNNLATQLHNLVKNEIKKDK